MDLVPLYIMDELKAVVNRVDIALNAILDKHIVFAFGEDEHIIKLMKDMNSAGMNKYPLIALVLPVDIERGNAGGYFGIARISRIVIATITNQSQSPAQRLENIIKPIIQPIYNEFLKQMCHQETFVIDGDEIEHIQRIRFGTQTAAQGFTEYIDGMELINMKVTLNQNCI